MTKAKSKLSLSSKDYPRTREGFIRRIEELEKEKDTVLKLYEAEVINGTRDEAVLHQKIKDNAFLTSLSYLLADSSLDDVIKEIALPAIREHTNAVYSTLSLYDPEQKALVVVHNESNNSLLNSIIELAGKQILDTVSPVSKDDYELIIKRNIKYSNSLTELSFGAIPAHMDKAIKKMSGLFHFYAIAHVHSGELLGSSFLAFQKKQKLPSEELLRTYSNLTAVSLRNKLTEQALKESEANLTAILENTTENIWSIDADYKILYINELFASSYRDTFGVRMTQGDDILESLPAPLQSKWKERYNRALNNEHFVIVDRVDGPDGPIFIEVAFNPIVIDGKVAGVSVYGKNITERKKAEQELLRATERNIAILNANPDLMFVFNADYIITDYNASRENSELYAEPEQFLGKKIEHTLPGELSRQTMLMIDQVLSTGQASNHNYKLEIDGKTQHFESRNVPSGDREVLSIIRNISRQKEAERTLLENEANLKAILENSLESVWSIGLDYKIQYVNNVFANEFYQAFGVQLGKGVSIYEALPQPLKAVWKERYDRAFRNEQYVFTEKIELGHLAIYVEVSINPIVVDGKVVGAALYGRDITESKMAELDLIAAKEKAEESDRLKTTFLANMSHEIRTPMNGIIGFAELLKEPGLQGEQQMKFIEIIEKSGTRMLNIINDLINISKIDAGEEELVLTETSLNEVLYYMSNFFTSEAEQKGITLSMICPLPDEKTSILCDREKLYAILTNLIKNAIKFTAKGEIKFGYSLKEDHFEFFVKDTGIGIPPDKQESVFSRFVQAESTLSRGYEGSGLGLPISQAYVEMLGGKIWLKSEPGSGSCFYFTLPSRPKDVIQHKRSSTLDVQNIDFNLEDSLVLIAEDDETSQLYLGNLLSSNKLSYLLARTGEEAVELCRANDNIDLVLMDIKLPVMDGYTAAKNIRKFRPGLAIIAQTAFALESEKSKFGEVFNYYLTKPINSTELKLVLQEYLT